MSNSVKLVVASAAVMASFPVMANEMRCGEHYISGDQVEPIVREQVLEKCGEPTSKTGDHWYYEKQGKILVFNSGGSLITIRDAGEE
jgi:hypothetical protein